MSLHTDIYQKHITFSTTGLSGLCKVLGIGWLEMTSDCRSAILQLFRSGLNCGKVIGYWSWYWSGVGGWLAGGFI